MLKAWIERFLSRRGFVTVATLNKYVECLNRALEDVNAEKRRHQATHQELDDAHAFIDKKLQDLTRLEPVVRWPKLDDQIRYTSLEPFDIARARVTEFIEGKRRDVIIAVAIPPVFDYWNSWQDIRAVNEAIDYVSKAAAHKISSTLRFGLTGDRV